MDPWDSDEKIADELEAPFMQLALTRGEAECVMVSLTDAAGGSHHGEEAPDCPFCRLYLRIRDALRASPTQP